MVFSLYLFKRRFFGVFLGIYLQVIYILFLFSLILAMPHISPAVLSVWCQMHPLVALNQFPSVISIWSWDEMLSLEKKKKHVLIFQ